MSRHPPRLACSKSTKAAKKAAVLSPRQSALNRSASHWLSRPLCCCARPKVAKTKLAALITSAEPSRLDAINWLGLNRDHWGIESGLHQRLDISHNDDRCRVRNDNAILVLGMMLRLSNSLFMQWRGYQRRPDHVTTTDFQSALSEDHHRPALRLALSKHPNLKGLS